MKMKKLLSIILCLAMCLSMFPVGAFAEENMAEATEAAVNVQTAAEEVQETAAEPEPEPVPEAEPEPVAEPEPESEPAAEPDPEPDAEQVAFPDQPAEEETDEEGGEVVPEMPRPDESQEGGEPVTETGDDESGLNAGETDENNTPETTGGEEETSTSEEPAVEPESDPEPEEKTDPQSVEEKQTEGVKVVFILTPEEAALEVYTKDEQNEKTVLQPEEDGSFLLLPGTYYYAATAEGYKAQAETEFVITGDETELQITVELQRQVRVTFTVVPEDAMLEVYTKDEQIEEIVQDGSDELTGQTVETMLQPEEDGSFLLLPGVYYYRASLDGYEACEETELLIDEQMEANELEICVTLTPENLVEIEEFTDFMAYSSAVSALTMEYSYHDAAGKFATRRIIVVTSGSLNDRKGAVRVLHFEDEYILQYETVKDAETAYEILKADKAYQGVYPDSIGEAIPIMEEEVTNDLFPSSLNGDVPHYSWGVKKMGLDLWEERLIKAGYGNSGRNIVVAVIDTGVSSSSFLSGRLLSGKDFVNNDSNPSDDNGHGTHVAGTICDGTPSRVKILPVKVNGADGKVSAFNLKSGIEYAISQNVDVINLSLGFDENVSDVATYLDPTLKKAYNNGITIIAAAGNENKDASMSYPASSSYAITIAALEENMTKASYSNYGSKVDFALPGSEIISTHPKSGSGLAYLSGTSMAAPHASAAAAALKCWDSSLSPSEIKNIFTQNSVYVSSNMGNGWIDLGGFCFGHPASAGETIIENLVFDGENSGKYEEVHYCTVCHAELDRKTVRFDMSGTVGTNLTWGVGRDGILTIGVQSSGTSGAMPDFSVSGGSVAPWIQYKNFIEALEVQGGVTSIGAYAFNTCSNIKSASLPASLLKIGNSAFNDCSNLKDVFFTGKEQQWNSIIKESNNNALINAAIHFSEYTIQYEANSENEVNGIPDSQTKKHGIRLTLSSTKPTRKNAEAGSYTITLDANGGSVSPTTLTANRTTRYTFRNWNTRADGSGTSYSSGGSYTANASVTLYAQWNASTTAASVTLPTPTRDEYIFRGWNTNSGASYGTTGSYTPTGNVTLYAIWEALPEYSVTYDANGGTGAPAAQAKKQGIGLTLSSAKPTHGNTAAGSYTVTLDANGGSVSPTTLAANRTNRYTFKNWNTRADGSGRTYSSGASYTADENVILYAQWNMSTTTAYVALPTPTRSGYAFKGWGTSSGASAGVTGNYTPDGNVTLYAVWKQLYPITYDANNGSGAPGNQTKEQGSTLTLSSTVPVRASTGNGSYELVLDANGGDVNPWTLRAERTIEYTFREWNTKPDGSGTSYAPGARYTADESATLYAQWNSTYLTASVSLPTPTREGYAFKGWGMNSGAASGVTGSYTPGGNETLIACWNALYSVAYDANDGSDAPLGQVKEQGIPLVLSTAAPARESVSTDCIVTLDANGGNVNTESRLAVRTTRYSFLEWNTEADGSGTSYGKGAVYTADENVTLFAQWESSSSTASVTLPTPSRDGYVFMGWSENSEDATGITGSYTPSDHVTLHALWRVAEKYSVVYNANGGSGAPGSQIKEEKKDLILSAAMPTRIDGKDVSYTVTLNAKGGTVNPERLTADNVITYSFREWNTEADGSGTGYAPGAKYTADESMTLYARWNSSFSAASVDLPIPVRNGYTFKGWSLDSTATNAMTGSYTPMTDVTLYAIWEENTILDSGTWDNLQWELDNHYNLTISGTGAMKKFASANTSGVPDTDAWRKYKKSIRNVVIEPGVSTVGDYSFYECSSLMSMTIPDGVTSIGYWAFRGCSKLTGVTIPQTVETIKADAFFNCTSLSEVTMQNGVTSIDGYAFSGCSALTTLVLPSSVTSLGSGAFTSSGLTSVTIPRSVTSMGREAFCKCSSLYNLTIEDGAASIGESAFKNCTALTHVTIPGSVKSFGGYAFSGCTSLESVSIQEGVTKVATYAFKDCSKLTCAEIPGSVASIAQGAFPSGCGLTEVYFGGSESEWSTVTISSGNEALQSAVMHYNVYPEQLIASGQWGSLQWKLDHHYTLTISGTGEMNALSSSADSQSSDAWRKYASLINKVVIESGVSSIGSYAFCHCTGLKNVKIPVSVTKIGEHAFDGCWLLNNVSIPSGVKDIGTSAFADCTSLTELSIPSYTSIGNSAFSGCIGLTELDIPENVSIGDKAFYGCSGLTNVTFRNGISSIGNSAFENCSGLTGITLPESIGRIGQRAFAGCNALTDLIVPGSVEYFGGSAFAGCTALKTVTVCHGVTGIDGYAFANCTNLKEVKISSSVTSLGDALFSGCTSLSDLYYPGSPEEWSDIMIGRNNEILDSIRIHFNTTIVVASGELSESLSWSLDDTGKLTISGRGDMPALGGYDSAAGKTIINPPPWGTNIKSLVVEDGVTSIGSYSFYDCSSLTNVTMPDSITWIGGSSFRGCSSLSSVTIPPNVSTIYGYTFSGCSSLSSVTIPSGVTRIIGWAFNGCSSLSSVTIPSSVTEIQRYAFCDCSSLSKVTIPSSVTKIGAHAFQGCDLASAGPIGSGADYEFGWTESIPDDAFFNCIKLTSVTIPSSVSIIGCAFVGCESLVSVTIPSGVTEIINQTFAWCYSLTSVSIPSTVTKIDYCAFDECPIKHIYYSGMEADWKAIEIDETNEVLENAVLHCMHAITINDPIANGRVAAMQNDREVTGAIDSLTVSLRITPDPGYTLESLNVMQGGTPVTITENNCFVMPAGDVQISATFKKEEFSISFDANGGTGAPPDQVKVYGEDLALSSAKPARESIDAGKRVLHLYANGGTAEPAMLTAGRVTNYVFREWNTKTDGTGASYAAGAIYSTDAAATLYAQWDSETTTSAVLLPVLTREGYDFLGWAENRDASEGVVGDFTPDRNMTLYALWKAHTYTVAYDANHGSGAPAEQIKTHDRDLVLSDTVPSRENSEAAAFTVTLNAGGGTVDPATLKAGRTTIYSFREWNTKADGTGEHYAPGAVYTAESPVTLYAQWNEQIVTAPVVLPVPVREGHDFRGWASDPAAAEGINGEMTPAGDTTLHALWEAYTYTVAYDANGGENAPASQTKVYDLGLTLSTSIPKNGCREFLGWATDSEATKADWKAGDTYTVNETICLYAVWGEKIHTPGNAVRENEIPASCSVEGSYDAVVYCTVCGEELSREQKAIETIPHTHGEAVQENVIPSSCTLEGSYEEVVCCSVCGTELSRVTKSIAKVPHTPGNPVQENRVEPTGTREGSYDEVICCSVCGVELSREKRTIEKLPQTKAIDIWCYFTEMTDGGMARSEACMTGKTFEPMDMRVLSGWDQLFLRFTPENADHNVTWSSENESVATVDVQGHVTFLKPGRAAVRVDATDGSGVSARVEFVIIRNVDSGTAESNIRWSVYEKEDGNVELIIEPEQRGVPSAIRETPWSSMRDVITKITIEAGITEIGDGAFADIPQITHVEIPEGVETIGEGAFSGCPNLRDVTLPDTVKEISDSAFDGSPNVVIHAPEGTAADDFAKEHEIPAEVLPLPIGIVLDREYLVFSDVDAFAPVQLKVEGIDEAWLSKVVWSVEGDGVVSVDPRTGEIISVSGTGGTDYVTATITVDGRDYTARCRVDVVKAETETPITDAIDNITIPAPKLTVELYSTNYTRIPVVLNLAQNLRPMGENGDAAEQDSPVGAIESAHFTAGDAMTFFTLRVVDDRTLEIVPKASALEEPRNVKLKGNAQIAVTIEGAEIPVDTPVTITVKQTLPKITAKAVKLNSYVLEHDGEEIRDEQTILFTGGEITALEQLDGKNLVKALRDGDSWKLRYEDATDLKKNAAISFLATVEGWAYRPTVKISVSCAANVPKLKFGASTLTLNPDIADKAGTAVTVVTPGFEGEALSTYVEEVGGFNRSGDLEATVKDGVLSVSTADRFDGSIARTFKVYIRIAHSAYPVTVKTLKTGSVVSFTVKTAGSIDTGVPHSPVTLTITPKNVNAERIDEVELTVSQLNAKTQEETDVTALFSKPERSGKVIRLTAVSPKQIPSGFTYQAEIRVRTGSRWSDLKPVKLPIKWSDPARVLPAATLKAKGSIDVIRPETEIVLTPTVQNLYGYKLKPENVVIYYKSGSSWIPLDALDLENPFRVMLRDESFVLRLKKDSGLNHLTDKYAAGVSISVKEGDGTVRTAMTKSPVALSVKMGSAKMTQSTREIQLLKQDRYSSATFTVGTDDAALAKIAKIVPAASYADYQIKDLGYGKLAVTFTGGQKAAKNTSLKFNVFLEGNETLKTDKPKPNAVISVKVTFA